MSYSEVVVLVPSHSLEDLPSEISDKHAGSILNGFAIGFHPALVASSRAVPNWRRADDVFDDVGGKLILLPNASEDRVPSGWLQTARDQGATVVSGLDDRAAAIEAALAPLRVPPVSNVDEQTPETTATTSATEQPSATSSTESASAAESATATGDAPENQSATTETATASVIRIVDVDPELAADFMALGTCWLLLELLTRHMHHFSSYDETFFRKTTLEAADAAVEGKADYARDRLRACFELMQEARERFYPVDCYLIDLCLLVPEQANDALKQLLVGTKPVNYLLKAKDAERIADEKPELARLMKEASARGAADFIGGDWGEVPSPLVPLSSTLHDLERGRAALQRVTGRAPTTWGRRRFGHSPLHPQLLQKSGFHSALHFLLDDGIYPDREQSKLRWDGCDSSGVDSITRLPLAAESASSYLRLPQRLAEAMQSDQVAALIIARWPEVKCPVFHDMARIQKYAPVLGRAVTFDEYFQHSEASGSGWGLDNKDYLSPFLLQGVARREQRPLSRFQQHFERIARFEVAQWQAHITNALYGKPLDSDREFSLRQQMEAVGPDAFDFEHSKPEQTLATADAALAEFQSTAAQALQRLIMHGASQQAGWLVTNSLSFARRVVVDLPTLEAATPSGAPAATGPVKAAQFDAQHRQVVVEIPAAGFAWIPADPSAHPTTPMRKDTPALASNNMLQNEFFEVVISEATGGLQRFKKHGRAPNRLSQQLAFRFPREKVVKTQVDDQVTESKTWYSEMRATSLEVLCAGPSLGETRVCGEIIDPSSNTRLATFQQTYRVWLKRPFLEIDIEITPEKMPEGDPWSNYYSSRFAWNDSAAALSWSLYGIPQGQIMERMESPSYLEIATPEERTTILPLGLPFHRKSGPRMVDSLLIVEGESQRRFRFVIGLDQSFPQQAALDHQTPVTVAPTISGPPRSGQTGWFYHIDSKCVQVLSLQPLRVEQVQSHPDWESSYEEPSPPTLRKGFALRLQETEGRYQSILLELFRRPTGGRVRDFAGKTQTELAVSGDGLRIDLGPFAIVEVEVFFD